MNASSSCLGLLLALLLAAACSLERRPVVVPDSAATERSDGGPDAAELGADLVPLPEAGASDLAEVKAAAAEIGLEAPDLAAPAPDLPPTPEGGAPLDVAEAPMEIAPPPPVTGCSSLQIGSIVPNINTTHADYATAVSATGDILFISQRTACVDSYLSYARKTATAYQVFELSSDPAFAQIHIEKVIFLEDGAYLAFLLKNGSIATAKLAPDRRSISLTGPGPFAQINAAFPPGAVSNMALSGDELSFVLSTNPPNHAIYEARRASRGENFGPLIQLPGELVPKGVIEDDYWHVGALSHDGLVAFVERNYITYVFERKSRSEPFVRTGHAPLTVYGLRVAGQCAHVIATQSPGGCQNGDIVNVWAK